MFLQLEMQHEEEYTPEKNGSYLACCYRSYQRR